MSSNSPRSSSSSYNNYELDIYNIQDIFESIVVAKYPHIKNIYDENDHRDYDKKICWKSAYLTNINKIETWVYSYQAYILRKIENIQSKLNDSNHMSSIVRYILEADFASLNGIKQLIVATIMIIYNKKTLLLINLNETKYNNYDHKYTHRTSSPNNHYKRDNSYYPTKSSCESNNTYYTTKTSSDYVHTNSNNISPIYSNNSTHTTFAPSTSKIDSSRDPRISVKNKKNPADSSTTSHDTTNIPDRNVRQKI